MARFDVYRFPSPEAPLVVDVQANVLSELNSRVVVPLAPRKAAAREALPRLKPVIRLLGEEFVFLPTDIAVVPSGVLREPVANLEVAHGDEITAALDFLFRGF